MCLAFMDYYPASGSGFFGCQTHFDPNVLVSTFGGRNYTAMDSYSSSDTSSLFFNGPFENAMRSSGRNMTYLSWVNSMPWNANNGALIKKMQSYALNAKQIGFCMIPTDDPDEPVSSDSSSMLQDAVHRIQ